MDYAHSDMSSIDRAPRPVKAPAILQDTGWRPAGFDWWGTKHERGARALFAALVFIIGFLIVIAAYEHGRAEGALQPRFTDRS